MSLIDLLRIDCRRCLYDDGDSKNRKKSDDNDDLGCELFNNLFDFFFVCFCFFDHHHHHHGQSKNPSKHKSHSTPLPQTYIAHILNEL